MFPQKRKSFENLRNCISYLNRKGLEMHHENGEKACPILV